MKEEKLMGKRGLTLMAISFLAMPLLSGCANDSGHGVNNIGGESEPAGYVNVYPSGVSGALHNKGMGWTTLEEQTELGKLDLGRNGTMPEIDNVGIQTSWDLIEKTEGKFDFSLIDKTIEYWTAQGKRINLRICTDSLNLPEIYIGAPRWLNEAPYNVNFEQYEYFGNRMARVNDLTDPNYKKFFERFMSKLAERYADNPYIETVDIRGYGMWGEWHSGHSFATMKERMFTLAYIIDEYAKAFGKEGKTLFLSNSWDYQGVNKDGSSAATSGNCAYEDYLAWSAIDHGGKVSYVGFRRDGLAGNGVTKYSTDEKALSDLIRSGKKIVNCGEYFSGFDNYISGLYGMDPLEATDELLFKSRCNYSTVLGWSNIEVARIVGSGYASVYNRGNAKMGYRFKIEQAKYPEGITPGKDALVMLKLSNSGVGRFGLPNYHLAMLLLNQQNEVCSESVDLDYDLRVLLNGETANVYHKFTVGSDLAAGTYTLAAAIVDQDNKPAIRLAQVGDYQHMIYPLGTIKVGNYSAPKAFYDEVEYAKLSSYAFAKNSYYEVSFDYTPSVALADFQFGDDNGFELVLNSGESQQVVANFQDVSGVKAFKTVAFSTGDAGNYTLSIRGTGIYENKIAVTKLQIIKKTGYLESFENNYNLLSSNAAWYCDNSNAVLSNAEDQILAGSGTLLLTGETPHQDNPAIFSDPSLLKLAPHTSYEISFKSKGYIVGGNACYYYLRLKEGNDTVQELGQWYERPDEPASTKVFVFTTGDSATEHLEFGVHNVGGFLLDDINVVANPAGLIVNGDDVKDINNVVPKNPAKGLGYSEGFEDMVLNDCTFTYGFDRWGHLTKDPEQVISGNYSMTSELDPMTYPAYFDSNWFEYMYSNTKYIKLAAKGSYHLSFKYRQVTKIVQNTDPTADGYAYVLARSSARVDADSAVINFANTQSNLGVVRQFDGDFTIGNADDYCFIIGLFGRGTLIIDDIVVTEK